MATVATKHEEPLLSTYFADIAAAMKELEKNFGSVADVLLIQGPRRKVHCCPQFMTILFTSQGV